MRYRNHITSVMYNNFKKKNTQLLFHQLVQRNEKHLDFGIIARNQVDSVLMLLIKTKDDFQSKTSMH